MKTKTMKALGIVFLAVGIAGVVCAVFFWIFHYWAMENGYRSYYDLVGEGKGYLAMNSVITEITWSRENQESPFVFKLADGTPVTLGVGSTYIGISSTKASPISYE